MESINQITKEWADKKSFTCTYFEETTSTNEVAKAELNSSSFFKLYLADHQTSGKGRGLNTWVETKGECLLSTWTFKLDQAPQHITGPRLGIAVFNAAKQAWPQIEWSLKAPNDLYIKNKKVAGILLESVSEGTTHFLIFGFGFNITGSPQDIGFATCLKEALGQQVESYEWLRFLDQLYQELHQALADCVQNQLSEDSREQLLRAINAHPHKKTTYLDVSPDGDLIFEEGKVSWLDI